MKNIKTLLYYAFIFPVILSCNNASDNSTGKKDSTVVEKKTVDSVAMKMSGLYSGNIPCADCAGILTYLSLDPDMTYRIEETYVGKNDTAFRYTGT